MGVLGLNNVSLNKQPNFSFNIQYKSEVNTSNDKVSDRQLIYQVGKYFEEYSNEIQVVRKANKHTIDKFKRYLGNAK